MNTPDILSFDTYRNCSLCPRMCKADRSRAAGYCGCSSVLTAARAALHHWEEPCISGSADADGGLTAPGGARSDSGGSGTVFFPAVPWAAASARIIKSAAGTSAGR